MEIEISEKRKSMSASKPLDTVKEYYDWVWTGKDVQRIRTLCANPVLRHDPGGDVALSHDEQIARIEAALSKQLQYKFIVSYGNDEFATMVWQAVSAVNRGVSLAGVQVLRVTGGRIAEVWNATKPELWVAQGVDAPT
ncbi:MAG: nuclear transport factor 2 family protein [Steroidobacteraceae bacterium]